MNKKNVIIVIVKLQENTELEMANSDTNAVLATGISQEATI